MNPDTISHILSFCGNAYVHLATVSKTWRQAYGGNRQTSLCEAVASVSRVGSVLPTLRRNSSFNNAAFYHASKIGNTRVLDLLLANKRPTALYKCTAGAVAGGNLGALAWAVANGFPLDRFVCHMAELNGNSEMLAWAVNNGCPREHALSKN